MRRRFQLTLACLLASLGTLTTGQSAVRTGTARIEGRVVGADGASPIRRAIVTLSGDVSPGRSTISDDNGAFAFANLPAGQFSLTASRAAFITSSYGAKSPGGQGTRISLAAGQTMSGALIRLSRGAVIAGTVRNDRGEPLQGIQLRVIGTQPPDAQAVTMIAVGLAADPAFTTESDDRGSFRVFGLPAGSYLIAAVTPQRNTVPIELLSEAEIDETFRRVKQNAGQPRAAVGSGRRENATPTAQGPRYGLPPVFYPGTSDAGRATPVTVGAGEERNDINFVFAPTRAVAIEGEVVSPDGPLPRVQLTLSPDSRVAPIPGIGQSPTAVLQPYTLPVPSGRFRYTGVTAGRYVLTARTLAGQVTAGPAGEIVSLRSALPGEPSPPNLWAETEVEVTSSDLSGIRLRLRPTLTLEGRVHFDGALAPPPNPNAIRLFLQAADAGAPTSGRGSGPVASAVPTATWQADGSFRMTSVMPGIYKVSATMTGPGTGWWLKSAIANGRDLLDEPLIVGRDDETLPPVVLTYSDRHTRVTGTLQTPAGAPATDYFIVVFTTERRFWQAGSRRLAHARPATNGLFDVRDLPPGEYYIAALDDLDTGTWQTAQFLDELVPGSLRLSVMEGETTTQDLRIAR
jgi:hypothetical protein